MNNDTFKERDEILRDNKPFEVLNRMTGEWWTPERTLLEVLAIDPTVPVRVKEMKVLDFAPIPEGAQRHNPDGLTAEQVGDGWRLCIVGEIQPEGYQYWRTYVKAWAPGSTTNVVASVLNEGASVRLPISTPYPDGSFVKDGKLVKPWTPKFKVGDRVLWLHQGSKKSAQVVSHLPVSHAYEIRLGDSTVRHIVEVALELEPLPLNPEDVPPGSLLRNVRWGADSAPHNWLAVHSVRVGGVGHADGFTSYEDLKKDYLIHRPGQTEWQPCHRPA